jgi:predicted ATP-binding protein involved in virulence
MFDHVIPLNLDDRITIIHGPNGFGKTIILKLLDELFNHRISELRMIPFDEFRVDFDDGSSFWVTKTSQSQDELEGEEKLITQQITFHATGKRAFTLVLNPSMHSALMSLIDSVIPSSLDRVGPETWTNTHTGEILSLEGILERFGARLPAELISEKRPEWLKEMRRTISVRLIETQRLVNLKYQRRLSRRPVREYEKSPVISTVTMYSNEIAETIKTKLAESASLAQSLDRTFPERVFDPTVAKRRIEENELRVKLAELEKKRARLMGTGLLDPGGSAAFQLGDQVDEGRKSMLSVYIEDNEKKLGVFDELAGKIDLLTEIINNRFLYKKMAVNKEQGFVFTTANNTILPLENLSSGEQHELVLFYELLFKVTPGSLILIDEPEISLHVVWQEQFLKDVQEITRLSDIDILMATHSPDLIGNRWDLTVQLEGPH